MRTRVQCVGVAVGCAIALAMPASADMPLGPAFTYQGQLKDGGVPVSTTADFEFTLWDAVIGGNEVAPPVTVDNVEIVDGLFTVPVDFGQAAFSGSERWLRIAVRTPHDPTNTQPYTELSPRQQLTATPYATHAVRNWSLSGNADTNPASDFLGTSDGQPLVLGVNGQPVAWFGGAGSRACSTANVVNGYLAGTPAGNHVAPPAVCGAVIAGGGTTGAVNFVTDDFGTLGGGKGNTAGDDDIFNDETSATCATVAGGCFNTAGNEFATVGGGQNNWISGPHATVAGGGGDNTTVTGNIVEAAWGSVGGGGSNWVHPGGQFVAIGGGEGNESDVHHASIGGGQGNICHGEWATIGGGQQNNVSAGWVTIGGGSANTASAQNATIGGGAGNVANAADTTVSGGTGNTVDAQQSTIGGGWNNTCHSTASASTIGGGEENNTHGRYATIGGGWRNLAEHECTTVAGGCSNEALFAGATVGGGQDNRAIGQYATVPGGNQNQANADYSFAAGRMAQANHQGAFVWADSTGVGCASDAPDQFRIQAAGGVGINVGPDTVGRPLQVGSQLNPGSTGIARLAHRAAIGSRWRSWDIGTGDAALFGNIDNFGIADATTPVIVISATTAAPVNDKVGIGTTAPTEKLDVDGTARLRQIAAGGGTTVVVDNNGKLWKQSSSRRYKKNVQPLAVDPVAVLSLQPVRFEWVANGYADIGLIAEDVAETLPDLVAHDSAGRPEAVRYDKVALGLLEVVRMQQSQLTDLQTRLERLEALLGLPPTGERNGGVR